MDKADHNPNTTVGDAMEKAAEVKATEATEVEPTEIVEYMIDIPTNETPLMYQGIAIYGSQLVSAKFLDIVKHALMTDDFLKEDIVKVIVFSVNQPIDPDGNPLFACYKSTEKLIAFNLQEHFDGAAELVKEVDGYMSLRGHIWYNMILSLFHELYHGLFIATDTESKMPSKAEVEATCNDMADDALTALCREFDVEPPPMGDEPFFGLRYMEFYIRKIKEGTDSWCLRQDALHDGMNIHYDDGRKEYIKLFRSFIRYTHGGDADHKDPAWDQDPKPLQIIADAITPAADAVAPAVEVTATTGFLQPAGVFHGPDTEEAVADYEDSLGLFDDAYTMEDWDTLPPEAVDFNTQVIIPPSTGQIIETLGQPVVPETPVASPPAQVFVQPVTAAPTQHVAESQQAHRGAPGQILPTNLPNHNFTPEAFRVVVEAVLLRLYTHLFNKCGYMGGMVNPCFDVNGKWGILERISIADIPDVDKALYFYDFLDQQRIQRTMVPITDGMLSGYCTKAGMLPAYTVYFNANGNCIKRVLLPQNSWKEKLGVLSPPALRAQAGAIIAWMMDGDDNTTKKFRGRIENSAFHWS